MRIKLWFPRTIIVKKCEKLDRKSNASLFVSLLQGAASVLIGLTFIGVNNQEVKADTTVAPEESVKVESSAISDITETIDNVVNTEDQSVSTANQAEAMSVEENNEVENDITASGETGNEEVKIDQSISSVETNSVEESATNPGIKAGKSPIDSAI